MRLQKEEENCWERQNRVFELSLSYTCGFSGLLLGLILKKNKVLDLVKGKIKKPTNESSDAEKEKFRVTKILAMTIMVDGIKDNLIPYISNIDSSQEMYEALSKLFTIKNLGQFASLKNELRTIKMTEEDIVASFFVRIARIIDELQEIYEMGP